MKHTIVGAGFGAAVHLPAFRSLSGVRVAAIADGGSGSAEKCVPVGVTPYDDWRAMLDRESPDTVSVAVPPVYHHEIVKQALARGIHVLCEKPFGMSLADAEEMESMRARTNLRGAVGFQFRYEPGLARMQELLSSGEVGAVRRIDVSWLTAGRAARRRPWSWQHDLTQGGGVINAFGSHVLDLLCWLTGVSVAAADGTSCILIDSRLDEEGRLRRVTGEDAVDALLRMENGVLSSIRITNCQRGGDGLRVEAFGESGAVVFSHRPPFRAEDASLRIRRGCEARELSLLVPGEFPDSRIGPMAALAKDFVEAVRQDEMSIRFPTFECGVRVHRGLAILRTGLSNGPSPGNDDVDSDRQ